MTTNAKIASRMSKKRDELTVEEAHEMAIADEIAKPIFDSIKGLSFAEAKPIVKAAQDKDFRIRHSSLLIEWLLAHKSELGL